MTTRKRNGKSKGKGKGNSRRNGRTKRGGIFGMFEDSFSWFGNNSKTTETTETTETNKTNETNETTEPAPSNKPFDWTFGLKDKLKLNPPPVPQGPTIIPGRPLQQPPQQQQPPPQDVPDATVTQNSTTSSQADQAAASQDQAAAFQAVPVTPVKGGRRLRLRTKKRSCRCKRK